MSRSMPMRSRALGLAAAAVLVIAASACTKTLDTEGLEGDLQSQVGDELGATITAVDCPDDVEVETGGTFDCTASEESGATFTIQVTQADDQGRVEWEVSEATA